jgi:hypothetical protein
MDRITYATQVRRRRDRWEISVPDLPGGPVVTTKTLGNAAPLLIMEVADYLGVVPDVIDVNVALPRREARPGWRERVTASVVQLSGGVLALSGLYLVAGAAYTLIATGLASAALAALRESGRI